jgi:hypothetical protein
MNDTQDFLLKTTSSGRPSSVQKTTSRKLKVESTGDFFYRKTKPAIRLKGKWLAAAGFAPDSYVTITLREPGVLEIRSAA